MTLESTSGGAITVERLSVRHRDKAREVDALCDVELSIAAGEFVTILGPSGCGKSTLLGAMGGFVRPASGSVTVDGVVVDRPGPRLGMVFQQQSLFPWRTVIDVILPQLRSALLASLILSFTFSFDDYVLSNFTAGATTQTWPMVIFAAVRFGVTPAINALATMMLGVTVLLILATGIVLRRGARTTGVEGKGVAGALGLG